MNVPQITEREFSIMEIIWKNDFITAQDIASHFLKPENGGYNKNTTYTFIRRLVDRKVIKRQDPGFICIPLYKREDIILDEAKGFLAHMYQGSFKQMFSHFIENHQLDQEELKALDQMIQKSLEEGEEC